MQILSLQKLTAIMLIFRNYVSDSFFLNTTLSTTNWIAINCVDLKICLASP